MQRENTSVSSHPRTVILLRSSDLLERRRRKNEQEDGLRIEKRGIENGRKTSKIRWWTSPGATYCSRKTTAKLSKDDEGMVIDLMWEESEQLWRIEAKAAAMYFLSSFSQFSGSHSSRAVKLSREPSVQRRQYTSRIFTWN